jgi:hypothetical protein
MIVPCAVLNRLRVSEFVVMRVEMFQHYLHLIVMVAEFQNSSLLTISMLESMAIFIWFSRVP